MATNQGGPMIPHADLVARLRERVKKHRGEIDFCTEGPIRSEDLVLAAEADDDGDESLLPCKWCATRAVDAQAMEEAADALAALPPPADPPNMDDAADTWGDIGPQPKGWPDGNNAVQWKPKPDCVIGVYCQRHGFIHGQEAEELRERLEELGNKSVNRVLDEVDARDSLAYLEATNEPTPPDAVPPQEGR